MTEATHCQSCKTRFRLMPRCPNGHAISVLDAYYCPQCGEAVSKRTVLPTGTNRVERFRMNQPQEAPLRNPLSPHSPDSRSWISAKISQTFSSIRRQLKKPKVRIIRAPQYAYPWAQPQPNRQAPAPYPWGQPPMAWGMQPQFSQQFGQPPFFSVRPYDPRNDPLFGQRRRFGY